MSLGNPHEQTRVLSESRFGASAAKTLLTLTLGTQTLLLDPAQISTEDPDEADHSLHNKEVPPTDGVTANPGSTLCSRQI